MEFRHVARTSTAVRGARPYNVESTALKSESRWPIRHDGVMPTVWISNTTPEITHDSENPGDHWQLVGEIASEVWKNFQRGSSKVSEFYLSGDPDSEWVQAAKGDPRTREPFWVAIDPYGSTRVLYADGASRKYFVSTEKAAVVTGLRRRPPEPHPGRLIRPVMIAIRLKRNDLGLFVPVDHLHRPQSW
jgi:hypothetical protein